MKIKSIYFLVAFAIYSAFTSLASASSVCVIDVEKIVYESKAGKIFSKKLEDKISAFQKKSSAKEKSLMQTRNNIQENHASMSKEELHKKNKEFEKNVAAFKEETLAERTKIEKMKVKGLEQIDNVVKQIAKNIAKEHNYQIMLPLSIALFYDDAIDITNELMSRLNKKLLTVEIE